MDKEQTSLFEIIEGGKKRNEQEISAEDNLIEVIEVDFKGSHITNYDEVFNGFNELRVMTFSFGLNFVTEIMHKFDKGEIIIGCNATVTSDAKRIIAHQEYSFNAIKKNKYLVDRIENDEFQFYISNDIISHQKIYLLKANDGRTRVIMGSGNMSRRAWDGTQIENFECCDNKEAYDFWLMRFETLRDCSTNHISREAIVKNDKDLINQVPIFNEIIKSNKAIVLTDTKNPEEVDYEIHINTLSDKYKNILPQKDKDGKILLDPKKVEIIRNAIKKSFIIKEQKRKINPQFVIDYDNNTATYNGALWDLNPKRSDVYNDIENLISYMNGFEIFTGNTSKMKESYYKVLNYMFLSPFIPYLRYVGSQHDYDTRFFPLYGLISGDSDSGKTQFIYTVWQLMFSKKLNRLPQQVFTTQKMAQLKTEICGVPILIDEMGPKYFHYSSDIVKIDDELLNNKNINHPTFIIISNDIRGVKPEISKRMFVVNLDNRLDKSEAATNSRKIEAARKKMSNSFYKEYLKRMFEAIGNLIIEIKTERSDDDEWYPDIFKISSNIIINILNECNIEIPKELHEFEWVDYMGENVISEKAKNIIENEWKYNKNSFIIDRKRNLLEIDFREYEDKERERKLTALHRELPAKLNCKPIGGKAILKLNETENYLEIKFKRNFSLFKKI